MEENVRMKILTRGDPILVYIFNNRKVISIDLDSILFFLSFSGK